jgi:glycosyltransferase involved in cell wall biosynthesis
VLTPFPIATPRHGGQVRAASIVQALRHTGWHVDTVGIYHADFFPTEEWGILDIVIDDPAVAHRVQEDTVFGDLHVARDAAADSGVINQLRMLLARLRPDIVHVEHPWSWLILQRALPPVDRPKVVYSSQNIEWSARQSLFELGLKRPGADRLVEATRLLEREFVRAADLTLSISDIEGALIAQDSARDVAYVPPVSDLAWGNPPLRAVFSRAARDSRCRYAALMGSGYWPNVEGFFTTFPNGLGFLGQDEQIWVAGSLGPAICADARYQDFQSVNNARLRTWGYVADADKASFFAAASCVIVPVHIGAGAKIKTADALASNCPVITTSHAIEGYGPLIQDVLGRGVFVADTPDAFRNLVRRALREGLPSCPAEVRSRVSLQRMAETIAPLYDRLLNPA